jgi:hypothetical protein
MDELLSEAAIRDLQIRYCRSVDRKDFELLESCFHPDATVEYGLFDGDLAGFMAMSRSALELYRGTTHFTGNQLVEVKGDRAWAEHYTVATHRCAADDTGPLRDLVTAVRYIDDAERRDGEWRIRRRVLILDWWRTDAVTEMGPAPPVQGGKRDRSDASYV